MAVPDAVEARPAVANPDGVSPAVAGRVLVGYAWRRRRLLWSVLALLVAALAGLVSYLVSEPTVSLWLADVAIICFVAGLAGLVRGRIVIFLAVISLGMLPLAAILQARGRLGPGAPVDEFNRDWFFVTAALVVAAVARSLEQVVVISWNRARGASRRAPAAAATVEGTAPEPVSPPRHRRSPLGRSRPVAQPEAAAPPPAVTEPAVPASAEPET